MLDDRAEDDVGLQGCQSCCSCVTRLFWLRLTAPHQYKRGTQGHGGRVIILGYHYAPMVRTAVLQRELVALVIC